jgi:hypothetical protein
VHFQYCTLCGETRTAHGDERQSVDVPSVFGDYCRGHGGDGVYGEDVSVAQARTRLGAGVGGGETRYQQKSGRLPGSRVVVEGLREVLGGPRSAVEDGCQGEHDGCGVYGLVESPGGASR